MLDQKLNFGRYRERSIIDVWKGNFMKIDKYVLENFLNESFDFFFGLSDFNKKILSNGYHFTNEDIELIEYLFINPELRKSISVKDQKILINFTERKILLKFSDFIIKYFNYCHYHEPHFNALKNPKNENENMDFSDASKILAECIPDPKYINWCIDQTDQLEWIITDFEKLKSLKTYYPVIILTKITDSEINFKLYAHIQSH